MTHRLSWFTSKGFVWIAALALAMLSDLLFYGYPLGWSVAIFAAVVGSLLIVRAPGLWKTWPGRIMVLLVASLVFALAEEPSPLTLFMTVVAVGTMVLVSQHDLGDRVSLWLWRWFELLVTLWLRLILDNQIVRRWIQRHPRAGGKLARGVTLVTYWLVPLVAGCVFITLFAVANPIIEQWLRSALTTVSNLLDYLPLIQGDRVFLWLSVGVGAYGLLRHRRMRIRRRDDGVAVPPIAQPVSRLKETLLGSGMIIRCLLVFNAVFAVQSILDAFYLYGGANLPQGMTYAHYAHRGAYTLIATALLAGAFVWTAFRTGGPAHRSPQARRLVYLWIAQNVFLLISTIWRLWLYVDVYSLTRLRVATIVWVILVATGFLWIIARIAASKTNTWMWRMNVTTLFAVMYVCSFINFDGLIADFNVRHCREVNGKGAPLDMEYLQELGPESLPALAWLQAQHVTLPPQRLPLDGVIKTLREQLAEELSDWRGWTLRRWREAPADFHRPAVALW